MPAPRALTVMGMPPPPSVGLSRPPFAGAGRGTFHALRVGPFKANGLATRLVFALAPLEVGRG